MHQKIPGPGCLMAAKYSRTIPVSAPDACLLARRSENQAAM